MGSCGALDKEPAWTIGTCEAFSGGTKEAKGRREEGGKLDVNGMAKKQWATYIYRQNWCEIIWRPCHDEHAGNLREWGYVYGYGVRVP